MPPQASNHGVQFNDEASPTLGTGIERVVLACPAKINLHLRVGPPRADGFHPLLTWMCTIGLFDTLNVWPTASAPGAAPLMSLTCNPPGLPTDERNLVVRVARGWADRLWEESRSALPPLTATLDKRTPSGAGLGGGSSDAAGMLRALARLWPGLRSLDAQAELAARLGSDIPFFLYGPSAICTGRGEMIHPIAQPRAQGVLLLLPTVHLPTPDVYRRFDTLQLGREVDLSEQPDWTDWAALPAAELLTRLVNDLEPAAFAICPALSDLRADAERAIGRPVRMSGSGSSLFTLFDTLAAAEDAARQFANDLSGELNVRCMAVPLCPVQAA